MKVIAKRGVCVGVNKHLKPGDSADLDAQTTTFLVSIGAVELVPPDPEAKTDGDEKVADKKKKPTPDEPGKKEK